MNISPYPLPLRVITDSASPSPPFRHWSGVWLVTFSKDAAEKRSNTTLSYKVSWPCWNSEGLRKIFMISSFSRGVGGWGSNRAQWLILKMVASRLSHKNTASSLLIMQHPGSPQSLTAMLLLPQTRYYQRCNQWTVTALNTYRLANPSRWHTRLLYKRVPESWPHEQYCTVWYCVTGHNCHFDQKQ